MAVAWCRSSSCTCCSICRFIFSMAPALQAAPLLLLLLLPSAAKPCCCLLL
jgi:hypothetical protein